MNNRFPIATAVSRTLREAGFVKSGPYQPYDMVSGFRVRKTDDPTVVEVFNTDGYSEREARRMTWAYGIALVEAGFTVQIVVPRSPRLEVAR